MVLADQRRPKGDNVAGLQYFFVLLLLDKMENLDKKIENWDEKVIYYTKLWAIPFSRFAIFVIYFWFGTLKVFTPQSPANPLVNALLMKTLPGVSFESFIITLGAFEMIIGLVFIIPHLQRLGIILLILHLVTTVLPLFVLQDTTWQSFLTPTLEGQYIIKNILIVALAIGILSHLHPLDEKV